ncbi:hypothetical protein RhiirA5_437253 [Rhizophagus irregularis]|uniref:Uncharacterized protein n=1 Tax=Rhizophagus irregularis TaxID=588596 RepID=A0A2N0NKR5_9GLOM|nr:hypothetical protein RhiirA5_437253 [Rhizophagus irregularis]
MQDLENLTLDPKYNDVLKTNGEIRPIWVLLIDGKSLCDIWRKDLIFGKSVDARYVEELTNPFENIEFEAWIENHCNLCQYSLDIKRCTNSSCCGLSYTKEIKDLLLSNNGFLPPTTKAKDGHFPNPIYLLEYYDLLKILSIKSDASSQP